jgi:hypothetical protein
LKEEVVEGTKFSCLLALADAMTEFDMLLAAKTALKALQIAKRSIPAAV